MSANTTSAPITVVGYFVEDGTASPVTARSGWSLTGAGSGRLGYSTVSLSSEIRLPFRTDADGNILYNYTTIDGSGSTVAEGEATWYCSSATPIIIEVVSSLSVEGDTSSSRGSTASLLDCFSALEGLQTSVTRLYRVVTIREATTTTSTSLTSETESTTTTSPPESTTTTSEPSAGGGPSGGVIAGAVVGSLAGLILLASVLYVGIRIGRKRAAEGKTGGFRDELKALPRPRVSVAWTRSPANTPGEAGISPSQSPGFKDYGYNMVDRVSPASPPMHGAPQDGAAQDAIIELPGTPDPSGGHGERLRYEM